MKKARAKIRDLKAGTRFRYDYGAVASLVELGLSGARVLFEREPKAVEFQAKRGDEVVADVSFARPGKPVLVSDYSDVEVLK